MSEVIKPKVEFEREEALATVQELAQAAFKAGDARFALELHSISEELLGAMASGQSARFNKSE